MFYEKKFAILNVKCVILSVAKNIEKSDVDGRRASFLSDVFTRRELVWPIVLVGTPGGHSCPIFAVKNEFEKS